MNFNQWDPEPETNQHWLLFYPQAEYQGRGPGVLRTDPPPDELNDWLSKCLLSGESDDAAEMAMEFNSRHEDWPQILTWLEQNAEMIAPESLDTFIKLLGTLNPMNREETLGKRYREITKDHQHFKDLAERAGDLLSSP